MPRADKQLAVVYRSVAGLVPYAQNARTHSEEQIDQIVNSIGEFGWTNPVLIDEGGGIIAGHGRVMAAKKIGMEHVPCIKLVGLTDAQKRAVIIADNKLALNADWDEEMLRLEVGDLKALNFELDLLGFDMGELDVIFQILPPDADGKEYDESAADSVKMTECPSCGHKFAV